MNLWTLLYFCAGFFCCSYVLSLKVPVFCGVVSCLYSCCHEFKYFICHPLTSFWRISVRLRIRWELQIVFDESPLYCSKSCLKSRFILLHEKPISLMSHLLKVFLKIIHQKIVRIREKHISRTQFEFRNAIGLSNTLFSAQVLVQRCTDFDFEVHVCFIHYRKAFDNV